eukprot:TRINITY_DN446_c0_g1_i1.p1 TRINITY_DN446_c0_g1~~TRINITY_DN446_c0_g1_i1.p1  ORF type:complete len:416 (-),score=109.96 TRINITY_DN446_c0_g1_i1:519-1718(-)
MELRVGNKYRIGLKIGNGAFGDIYQGHNIMTGEEIAIKLEPVKSKHPQLFYEYKLYKVFQGGAGVPKVYWFGVEGDYNVMVMQLLGPSLEDLFACCGNHLSLKTVLMLADQMLRRVEFVHSKNFLHRDIKPDNFLMGTGNKSTQLYIIDFGLAKKYRDPKTHQHIPYRENKSLTGTARYASLNTHLGIEQSRRDDLEAIGYVMVYFIRGSLPWQGLKAENKRQKYERISEKKLSTSVDQLCKGCPPEFATYLTYCKSLHFEDKPDYAYLRKLLRNLFVREGFKYDAMYDWTMIQLSRKSAVIDEKEQKRDQADTTRAVSSTTQDFRMPTAATGKLPECPPVRMITSPPPAGTRTPTGTTPPGTTRLGSAGYGGGGTPLIRQTSSHGLPAAPAAPAATHL